MDIRVWSRDDKPLTEEEYAQEVKIATDMRAKQKGMRRLSFWLMDRAYLKALRKGRSISDAHDEGIADHAMFIGILIGSVATLLVVGTVGWAWNLYLTARGINLALALIFWVVFCALGITKIRKWTAGSIKRAWRRIRPEKNEESDAGPKATLPSPGNPTSGPIA